MSFKNAFKNLITHFGVVWSILLYLCVCVAIIVGLSLPFILPIKTAFEKAGVFAGINDAFSALLNDGGWKGFWDCLYVVYDRLVGVFENNDRMVSLTMSFVILVLIVAFRFFFGLYEIPLATVLDGRMSCNAEYGFGGKFFSTLPTSVLFSLAKMPIMFVFDALLFGIAYGLGMWLGLNVVLPVMLMLEMFVLRALRSSLMACWAPCVAGGSGVIKGLARSIEICFKRFGSIFSTNVIVWLLIVSFGAFVTVFTLGVGIMVVVPFSMAELAYTGITLYYAKTGKRYYIDGTVYTPPMEKAIKEE